MDHQDWDLERILAFCNDVREVLGRKPVSRLRKGCPMEPQHCVLANTINYACHKRVYVDQETVDFGDLSEDNFIVGTPEFVRPFINAFDNDELPEFDGQGWYGA